MGKSSTASTTLRSIENPLQRTASTISFLEYRYAMMSELSPWSIVPLPSQVASSNCPQNLSTRYHSASAVEMWLKSRWWIAKKTDDRGCGVVIKIWKVSHVSVMQGYRMIQATCGCFDHTRWEIDGNQSFSDIEEACALNHKRCQEQNRKEIWYVEIDDSRPHRASVTPFLYPS